MSLRKKVEYVSVTLFVCSKCVTGGERMSTQPTTIGSRPSGASTLTRSNSRAGQQGSDGSSGVGKIAGAFKSLTRTLKPQHRGEYKLNNNPLVMGTAATTQPASSREPLARRDSQGNTRSSNQSLSKKSSEGSIHAPANQQDQQAATSRRSAPGQSGGLVRKLSSTASSVTNRYEGATGLPNQCLQRPSNVL
jgi:hypothetical protein